MRCNKCGAINPNSNKFCGNCGESLIEQRVDSFENDNDIHNEGNHIHISGESSSVVNNNKSATQYKSTIRRPKSRNKKLTSILIVFTSIIILSLISFFVVKEIRARIRNEKFNSELQSILEGDLTEESGVEISVSGNYGSVITYTDKEDSFSDFISLAKTEEEEVIHNQLVSSVYKLICTQFSMDRLSLIISYADDEEYENDKSFAKFTQDDPLCRIITPTNTYEFYKDRDGDSVFTVNGEIEEEVDLDEVFSYGNPSPALEDMMDKYNTSLDGRDIQYDMDNNINEYFGLEGTAELCDYYNWGYDDSLESTYFCMEVSPNGGSYSDHWYWYLYANRQTFDELYKDLQTGEVDIQLIAQIEMEDSTLF